MVTSPGERRSGRAGLAVVVAAVLLRCGLLLVYRPTSYPDSESYLEFGRMIAAGNLDGYWGARTPVYPLLLVLLRSDPWAVWIAQSICGVATAWLVTRALVGVTGHRGIALAGGLLVAVSPNLLFFEPSLLTESLSTLLLTAFGTGAILLLVRDEERPRPWFWLGLLCGISALTRPQFIVLLPACLLCLASLHGPRARAVQLAAFAAPALVLILAWCGFNWSRTGSFSPTNLAGINLTNHTGAWIEEAPAEFQDIAEPYIAARQRYGTHCMMIWAARPALLQANGGDEVGLNRRLLRMDVALIVRRPELYLGSVAWAWAHFWSAPYYWDSQALRSPSLAAPGQLFNTTGHLVFIGLNAVFLLAVLFASMRSVQRDRGWFLLLLGAGPVLALSFLQAAMERGENGRYGIPTQPLVVLVIGWALCLLRPRAGAQPGARTPGVMPG
jgi:hypothetical protein